MAHEETDSAEAIDAAHRMRAQQLSLVFGQALRNQILSPIVGALLAGSLWRVVDRRLLVGWVLALCGVSLWRHRLARSYHRAPAGPLLLRVWERRFLISLTVASAVWGIGTWVLMPAHADAYQALIYCFVVGMAGGTSALYAAHGPSVAVAIILIMAPSTVYLFTFADTFHSAVAVAGALFVLAASRGARVMNETMRCNVQLAGELERSARIDLLSGLNNRRGFTEFSTTALANASRAARPCALVMIDVDHFKAVNDRMGHAAGDAVIRSLGDLLAGAVRTGECAGRIGGEEFAVVLPHADDQQALAFANRILNLVRTTPAVGDQPVEITVSIGVAATRGAPITLDELLIRADKAMYTAKRNGRDRVVVADDASTADAAAWPLEGRG